MTPALLLPVLPDGASPTVERLEWLTDVATALDGTEARKALRAVPRATYSGSYVLSPAMAGGRYAGNADVAGVLAALRTAETVEMPLACHASFAGDEALAGFTGATQRFLRFRQGQVGATVETGATARGTAFLAEFPLVSGWLTAAREVEHATTALAKFQLQLQVQDGRAEAFSPALDPQPTTGSADALLRHNWVSALNETLEPAQDTSDNGHLRVLHQRFVRRTLKLQLLLRGRSEIVAFRRFAHMCQGRYRAFPWQAPIDPTPGTWRLGADAVEIEYVTRTVARVQLPLTELKA